MTVARRSADWHGMWPYIPALLERPVPRYTSYPTAAEFEPVDAAFHETGFEAIAPGAPISLYVHIPFCEKICWYCGCNTGAANRKRRLTAYLDALHAEIETVAARLEGHHPVSQIAFGGGSPNAIVPVDFVRLVDHLLIAFEAFDSRISVELDPRSLTAEWIEAFARLNISHASLGVQTFEPEIQAAIGRVQTLSDVAAAVEGLRRAGVRSLNFDLMYGLPGQDIAVLDRTLDQAIDLAPDRIALFGYAHLPAVLPRQRRIADDRLPDLRERFSMAAYGHEKLADAGYMPIGFDHFALPHDAIARAALRKAVRRNFQGFTDDPAETLLAFGASAISALPDRFVQNEKNSGQYRLRAAAGAWTGARGVRRSQEDRIRERMINALLCSGETELGNGMVRPEGLMILDRLFAAGLIDLAADRLCVTEKGRPYARMIASQLDVYRNDTEMRFSMAI